MLDWGRLAQGSRWPEVENDATIINNKRVGKSVENALEEDVTFLSVLLGIHSARLGCAWNYLLDCIRFGYWKLLGFAWKSLALACTRLGVETTTLARESLALPCLASITMLRIIANKLSRLNNKQASRGGLQARPRTAEGPQPIVLIYGKRLFSLVSCKLPAKPS